MKALTQGWPYHILASIPNTNIRNETRIVGDSAMTLQKRCFAHVMLRIKN